jgi:drug/metabolite transporter (DMT)-like permease
LSAAALLLALSAAFLHAFWNLILARAADIEAATAVTMAAAVVVVAPIAAVTWRADSGVWRYAVPSAALELTYIALLAAAYRRAELSVVYPIARGGAPALVLVGGVVLLGLDPSAAEIAGVLAIVAGILLVRGIGHPDRTGLAFGVAIAACIAGYTLLDSRGIDHASVATYLLLVLGPPGLVYLVAVAAAKGRAAVRAQVNAETLVAGAASFAAFALVLAALRLGSPAAVSAVRETSVVIAVVLAAVVLRERVGAGRMTGAAVVVAGLVLLSF